MTTTVLTRTDVTCIDCHTTLTDDDAAMTDAGALCGTCADEYAICAGCTDLIPADDIVTLDCGPDMLCGTCADDHISHGCRVCDAEAAASDDIY